MTNFKLSITTILFSFFLLTSFWSYSQTSTTNSPDPILEKGDKIPVLNFGTFHMGLTNDENKTEFDEHDRENQKKVHEIAEMLASFKPTVILVERIPESNDALQSEYKEYLRNPNMFFKQPSEIELLAYELGRICNTKRIYGIDHKMSYNYKIGNADILTHVGSEKGFEGADEAAKYYQRNLRMYSNLNRIELNKDDRVFILMGASHTAFFRDFMSRSPKYYMVKTSEYLK